MAQMASTASCSSSPLPALSHLLSSPSTLPTVELATYFLLGTSILVRYRHNIFHYLYRNSPRLPPPPKRPWEAVILLALSTALLVTNLRTLFRSQRVSPRQSELPTNLSAGDIYSSNNLVTAIFLLTIILVDLREEYQFRLYTAAYWAGKPILANTDTTPLSASAPADEEAKAETEAAAEEAAPSTSPISATAVYTQYQVRASIKALLGFAALVFCQLDLQLHGHASGIGVKGVPLVLGVGAVYLVRTAALMVGMERFRRAEVRVAI